MAATKHNPTDVGKITLERQAMQFNSRGFSVDKFFLMGANLLDHSGIRTIDLPLHDQNHCPLEIRPFLLLCCNQFYSSNKLYFGVRAIEITQK